MHLVPVLVLLQHVPGRWPQSRALSRQASASCSSWIVWCSIERSTPKTLFSYYTWEFRKTHEKEGANRKRRTSRTRPRPRPQGRRCHSRNATRRSQLRPMGMGPPRARYRGHQHRTRARTRRLRARERTWKRRSGTVVDCWDASARVVLNRRKGRQAATWEETANIG